MATKARPKAKARVPVTRARALEAAVELADAHGLEELTMRRLAEALSVEAMSLYHHVPNKDAILDGMVDLVFAEIPPPALDVDWQTALRARMNAVRTTLLRHPWALRILESRRSPGPVTLAHHDAVLGCLRAAGFSVRLAAHAYSVLDAYVFGFVHTELTLPFRETHEAHAMVGEMVKQLEGTFPHLAELTREVVMVPDYTYGVEFPYGLELILDGLERALSASR